MQDTPEATAAAGLLTETVAKSYFANLMRWLAARNDEGEQWQRAAFIGDRILWVTADELAGIGEEMRAVTDKYFERLTKPESRPPGARPTAVVNLGFPDMTLPEES